MIEYIQTWEYNHDVIKTLNQIKFGNSELGFVYRVEAGEKNGRYISEVKLAAALKYQYPKSC